MSHFETNTNRHDPFGWLKTLGVILALFGFGLASAMAVAKADTCAASCRAQHNQCRIATKGQSAACDQQLNVCVNACFATKK
jgi:hypothetical protein